MQIMINNLFYEYFVNSRNFNDFICKKISIFRIDNSTLKPFHITYIKQKLHIFEFMYLIISENFKKDIEYNIPYNYLCEIEFKLNTLLLSIFHLNDEYYFDTEYEYYKKWLNGIVNDLIFNNC